MSQDTHSLADVAAKHLPQEWKHPVRWLKERLNRGELRGVRLGRVWRMRDTDIDYMLSRYSNAADVPDLPTRAPAPVVSTTPVADGLSARSRRRLRSAS